MSRRRSPRSSRVSWTLAGDRPRFRREDPAANGPQLFGLLALFLIFGALALTRSWWMPSLPEGALVEVRGDVPHPGTYLVEPATIAAAVEAAGGTSEDGRAVPAGHVVVVRGGAAVIQAPEDPLLVALPVDVNRDGPEAIAAIPGIGRSAAEAIVADREARGPFYDVSDLERVRGIGGSTLETLRPFVTVGEPGERPPPALVDLNVASASELEQLPGIGPVTAARIVVDREDNGPFRTIADLQRVKGIGPATTRGLEGRVEIR